MVREPGITKTGCAHRAGTPVVSRWLAVGEAVMGRLHQARGQPCQDSVSIANHHGVLAMALADGAGSRPHSQLGARALTQAACTILTRESTWEARQGTCALRHSLGDKLLDSLLVQARASGLRTGHC